jgi:hypothetical protein
MANTISAATTIAQSWRTKYLKSTLEIALRKMLVAEAICQVDRSDSKYVANPYGNQPTADVHTMAGTYAVSALTITDDYLEVTDEFTYGEHIYGFEEILSNFNLWASRVDELTYAVAAAIDKWVLNELADNGTGTYDTPAGGFTTAGNLVTILGALQSKVAGYADNYKGTFLVVENTDLAGIIPAMAGSGFNMADSVLKNGFVNNYMGTDIYVVRTGTFADESASTVSGTKTWLNAGKRLFGVKGVATYAAPRGIQIDEKLITLKTGRELSVWGLCGFKLWTPKASLIVVITLK